MSTNLLTQLASAEGALVGTLLPRVIAVRATHSRVVSAIAWRSPYLVTAAEAVAGLERVRLRWREAAAAPAAEAEGELLAVDLTTDVAVIACQAAFSAERRMPLPTRAALQLGERVALVAAHAHGPLAAWGTVSAAGPAWRSRRGGEIDQRLEFDAALDRRFEGALVSDTEARVAALLVPGPRVWLGIPAATVERVLAEIERHGHLPRPYLGLRLQNLWLDASSVTRFGRSSARIAVIAGVDSASPAAAAQLEPGDLIDTLDGREADGVDGIGQALMRTPLGGTVTLGLRRGGELQTRRLSVAERPRAGA